MPKSFVKYFEILVYIFAYVISRCLFKYIFHSNFDVKININYIKI